MDADGALVDSIMVRRKLYFSIFSFFSSFVGRYDEAIVYL
jgi:hypothetical protein